MRQYQSIQLCGCTRALKVLEIAKVILLKNNAFSLRELALRRHLCYQYDTNQKELKRFSMNPAATELNDYMHRHYPGGSYISAYEAGFFLWLLDSSGT